MLDNELIVSPESAFGVVFKDGKIFWDGSVKTFLGALWGVGFDDGQ